MSIAAYQGVCPTCRHDHSNDTFAPTTRETADHIGKANEKVVQTPMHRDAAKAALALRTADHAELARIEALLREHIKVDASGLAPAVVSHFVFGFDTAASALLSEIAALRGDVAALDEMRGVVRVVTARATQAERQRDELRKALEWYGEQARLARLIHREGDAGRHALADDGGKLARQVLANQGADQ